MMVELSLAELILYGVHKMIKIEHNVETGELIEIQLTAEEIKELENGYKLRKEEELKLSAELLTKENAKAELLAKLGITQEEAKLLLS